MFIAANDKIRPIPRPDPSSESPLWGLASRPTYLHDGRTDSLHTAIRAHAGEATPSRNRYVQLPEARQQQLIAFLRSL